MNGRSFELRRTLGDGAFGTVYLADLVSTGGFRKTVALKLLKPDWDAASDAARRLRDEARLLGRLRHRHIVRVDDLIRLDGRWAVVMEYVEGVDLELLVARFEEEPIPPAAALEIVAAVTQALDAAWNGLGADGQPLRVVHRDIKPSNIRLGADGEVKVLDFGIARAEFQGREAKTERVRYGSIGYMSPERLLGDPEIPAGDVFAIGAVLYELLTGEGFGRTKLGQEAAEQMLTDRMQEARRRLPAGCEPILALVARCLAYEVADRPDAASLATELRTLARTAPGQDLTTWARRVIPPLLAAPPGHTEAPRLLTEQVDSQTFALDEQGARPATSSPTLVHDPPEPAPPASRPRPLALALGLLAGLAVGAAAIALVLQGRDPAPDLGPAAANPSTEPPGPTPSPPAPEASPAAAEPAPPDEATAAATAPPAPATEDPPPAPPTTEAAAGPPTPSEATATGASARTAPRGGAETSRGSSSSAGGGAAASGSTAAGTPSAETSTTAEPPPTAAIVDRVKFHVPGASQIDARCGEVSRSSASASVNLSRVPAGACVVRAVVDGAELSARIQVNQPNGYTCQPTSGSLSCTSQL